MNEQKPGILRDDDMSSARLRENFALDVLNGLSQPLKRLPTEYIYDEVGSQLFQQITGLPEYYLTRCETGILEENKGTLREITGTSEFNLVELGAGDGQKTVILLKEFAAHRLAFRYIPIDISGAAIEASVQHLKEEIPGLVVQGLVSEYFNGLKHLSRMNRRRNLVLFLGSNIGNFEPARVDLFLSSLWHALNEDDMVLIGFDLKKDITRMIRAYNDAGGITAKFNCNLLERINHELGGHFDLQSFRFYATYDVSGGAIMSYLVSMKDQEVYIDDLHRSFIFKAWEPIHTESSYKFHIKEIEELAAKHRFDIVTHLYDNGGDFVDSVWRVRKEA